MPRFARRWEIVVEDWDLRMASNFYGLSCTLRVMHHVLVIGALGGTERFSVDCVREALCSAVIHDMAWRHEGHCELRGFWSVEEKLPEWRNRFRGWVADEEGMDRVAFAVQQHFMARLPKEFSQAGLPVLHLLQDVDALDRVRFKGWCDWDCMDPARLFFHAVTGLEPAALLFFRRFGEVEGWGGFF